jgi:cellulose synthase (UDP-forming)
MRRLLLSRLNLRAFENVGIWILRVLVALGFAALLYYISWWFEDRRLYSPWLILMLALALLFSTIQFLGNWVLYLAARHPTAPPAPSDELSVDVFVTVCGEPIALVRKTVTAACALRGKHATWLLDDFSDPALAAMAEKMGVGYLTRQDRNNAKAGNLNAALARTTGDIVLILDVDHVPACNLLERTLGHFTNPKVGFVQVMLTFANNLQSWVAAAAMETSLEFYNPTSLGTEAVGSATLMGSNALIRRTALESIGGYRPGLAEDLATSIALHAAGWSSAYVHEPLAPGMAPPDLPAWFTQQLKWARGVFELLLTAYPRAFPRLTWGQRISYAVRMTKYWIGPIIGFHLFATIAVMILGDFATRWAYHLYLRHLAALVIADMAIRYTALQIWRHDTTPNTALMRAVALVYATWPIYLLAWLMALLRIPLKFRPTPKEATGGLKPLWLLPQFLAIILLSAGILYTVLVLGHPLSLLLTAAVIQGILQLKLFAQWLSEKRYQNEAPDSLP